MSFGKRGLNLVKAIKPSYQKSKAIDEQSQWQASEWARYERELDAQAALMNRRVPSGCKVTLWQLIPVSVWNGPYRQFLMGEMFFFPYHPLNNMLLSANAYTVKTLDLPMRPQMEYPWLYDQCNSLLGELIDQNLSKQETIGRVVALAQYIGELLLGVEAFDRHTFLFGMGLGMGSSE